MVLFVKQNENWFFYAIIWTRHNITDKKYGLIPYKDLAECMVLYKRLREKCKIQQP
jgi:hypothetical protein